MSTLLNTDANLTYVDLLQLGNSGGGITGSLQTVEDGSGSNTALQVSTIAVNVVGTFTVNNNPIITSAYTISFGGNFTTASTFSTTGTFSSGGNFSTSSTVSVTGAVSITGAFTTAGAFTTVGANSITFTTTGSTSITLPTSGTLTTTSNNLSVFASTTSLQLKGVISDETGSGALVFATSPTLVTPLLGTPTSGVLTNCTGTASGLTSGHVTTNANLTGDVTSVGNATTITTIASVGASKSDQVTGTSTTKAVVPNVQQNHSSAVKFWVSFAGSNGAIGASYGVTSVSRSSTGVYVITPSTVFTSANWVPVGITSNSGSNCYVSSIGTSSVTITTANTSTGSVMDCTTVYVCGMGIQ